MLEKLEENLGQLIEARDHVATVVERETRFYSEEEISRLGQLNAAIDAIVDTLRLSKKTGGVNHNPDYRIVASAAFQELKERYHFTSHQQASFGAWLVATLSAVHIGAIYVVSSLHDIFVEARVGASEVFIVGLVLALACGFGTWTNWSINAHLLAQMIKPGMLVNEDYLPKVVSKSAKFWVWVTFWAPIILGLASVSALVIGSLVVIKSL